MAAKKTIAPGTRFHLLTVIGPAPSYVGKNSTALQFHCRCECGKTSVARGSALRSGVAKSCGCFAAAQFLKRTTHGHVGTRVYNSWRAIRWRCEHETCDEYLNYGGRGIAVCERWKIFENFLADMGECPPRMSIDRIDNDGNYEPGNCRWASRATQARNKRTTLRLTIDSIEKPVIDWAALAGVSYKTVHHRISRNRPPFMAKDLDAIRTRWCSPDSASGTGGS